MKSPYGKNIHIIGIAGTEGSALLEYLHVTFPKAKLTAHDYSSKKLFLKNFKEAHSSFEREEALEKGKEILGYENVNYYFQDNYLSDLERAETIFVPQSWYLYEQNKPLSKYQDTFCSLTRLYFDLFPGKIIGVTGSNGKTTTTTLIARIMQNYYPKTLFSGNDRRTEQVLQSLKDSKKEDWLVLEISNRQLKIDLGKSPDISVITNITPNHLTEHKDFADYAKTKASLLQYQTEYQWSVLNADDPESQKLIEIDDHETMPFSTQQILPKGVFVEFGNIVIKHAEQKKIVMPVSDFPIPGKHNLSNALAAIASCFLAHVPLDIIADTLRSVSAIPQRMELITTIKGVSYYNDTASTAPESTIAGIETLGKKDHALIIILGGKSKGLDYSSLAETIIKKVQIVLLLKSPLSQEMQDLLKNFSGKIFECETLQEAVSLASHKSHAGDIVLFSPAAEYFTYFKDKMPGYKNFRDMVLRIF